VYSIENGFYIDKISRNNLFITISGLLSQNIECFLSKYIKLGNNTEIKETDRLLLQGKILSRNSRVLVSPNN